MPAGYACTSLPLGPCTSAARPANPLDACNQPLAVGTVLQEHAQGFHRARDLASIGFVEQLETLNVSFVLQDAGNLDLEPRRGHVDARVLAADRVAKAGQH